LAPSLRITEKAGHAVVATLHHVLSNAGEIQPWESSHDAQHPSGNCGMLSVSIVRSRRRSAEKALWPRYPAACLPTFGELPEHRGAVCGKKTYVC